MKKVIFLMVFLASAVFAQKTDNMKTAIKDSLTGTQKSVLVKTSEPYNFFTITMWSSTGTDTVRIKTSDRLVQKYSTKALIDLQTNAYDSIAVVTTTAKEWQINDPEVLSAKLS